MSPSNSSDESPEQKSSWWLRITLALTLIGGLIGSYLLGPYGIENAIPSPYVVGFGFGALPTLIIQLLGRSTFGSFQKKR